MGEGVLIIEPPGGAEGIFLYKMVGIAEKSAGAGVMVEISWGINSSLYCTTYTDVEFENCVEGKREGKKLSKGHFTGGSRWLTLEMCRGRKGFKKKFNGI